MVDEPVLFLGGETAGGKAKGCIGGAVVELVVQLDQCFSAVLSFKVGTTTSQRLARRGLVL